MLFEAFGWEEIDKYNIDITGIIHAGAHCGEERDEYFAKVGSNVVWFEADEANANTLKKVVREVGQIGIQALLTDEDDKEYTWYIQSYDSSSSIFKPNLINVKYDGSDPNFPYVYLAGQRKITSKRFDTLWPDIVKENDLDPKVFNFLLIDTQGSELLVLKGMGDFLYQIQALVTEYSTIEWYKDIIKLYELDEYLISFGFRRTYPDGVGEEHGNAVYIREL